MYKIKEEENLNLNNNIHLEDLKNNLNNEEKKEIKVELNNKKDENQNNDN